MYNNSSIGSILVNCQYCLQRKLSFWDVWTGEEEITKECQNAGDNTED